MYLSGRAWLIATLVVSGAIGSAHADYHDQTINTSSLAFAQYDPFNDHAGPFPFNNFGVSAGVSIGTDVAVSTTGATEFVFPTINPGQTFTANASSLNYAYTPSWSGGSIGSHTGLSANANFSYDIGPFSGNDPIYDTALNTQSNGVIGGGATLTGGSTGNSATGPTYNFSYTESAYVASATAGLKVGVNLQSAVNYTATVQYGYYSWVNTTGTLSAADTLTWHGVSGGDLSYLFPSNLAVDAGSEKFFLNFLPAVQMEVDVSPTQTITVPLTGFLEADAFGATLADINLSLGNLYSLTYTDDTLADAINFYGKGYYSLDLQEDNSQCQIHPGPSCESYDVLGSPILAEQTLLTSSTNTTTTLGSHGIWTPGTNGNPPLPDACDPATGICYASTDPNMPIGPGTVSFTSSPVPEPANWTMLIAGFALMGGLLRRRLSVLRQMYAA